jgi:alpha-mannosidase
MPEVAEVAARACGDELELRAVAAGAAPRFPEGTDLLRVEPPSLVLSALKPAEDGDGLVLRLLNPGDEDIDATVRLALGVRDAVSVRLDESPDARALRRDGSTITLTVGPHELRSVRLRLEPAPR